MITVVTNGFVQFRAWQVQNCMTGLPCSREREWEVEFSEDDYGYGHTSDLFHEIKEMLRPIG